jgi:tripartite ATP-independent transporter DctM subunit
MNEIAVGIVVLFLLLGLFLTGIELAFAMAIMGFLGYAMLVSFQGAMNMMAKDLFDVFSSYGLTVIPVFVLMGQISFNAGIAGRLYDMSNKFIGHIPGGLAIATIVGATFFKAICGSSAATVATFSSVAVPEMERYGYAKKLSGGVVAIVGTLGVLIPPSVILIIFGIITQQSIGKLFMAAFIPSMIIALFYIVIIVGWCKFNPALGPTTQRHPWNERIRSVPSVIWPVVIFALMVGGLMGGIFTPTEAGSVGAAAVLILTLFQRQLNYQAFKKSIMESLRTCAMVIMLIAGSTILGHAIAVTNIPMVAADWIVELPLDRNIIMVFIILVYLIGGSFIDDLAFMILATPIFYPAILKLGYDPLWAGVMVCIAVMIGAVIPPVAMCVFIVKNITKIPLGVIYSGVYPFLIGLILAAALLFVFPQLVLYLPSVLMK